MFNNKGKRLFFFISIIFIVFFVLYRYFGMFGDYKETRSHLIEIYNQMDKSYSVMVSYSWTMLDDWGNYINRGLKQEGEEFVHSFIDHEKEVWEFEGFYFLDDSGRYITESGEVGAMIGARLPDSSDEDASFRFMGYVSVNGTDLVLSAVKTEPGTYMGFDYTGIGICFASEYVNKFVDVSGFHEGSECYMVYPEGQIMFSPGEELTFRDNLVDYLTEKGDFKRITAEEFRQIIGENKVIVEEYETDGIRYYVACQPISVQKGMIVGIVPADVVNSYMIEVRRVSATIFTLAFVTLLITILIYVLSWSHERFMEKDKELMKRDRLFKFLADRTDDMYILFSSKDFKVQFVSSNIERVLGIRKEQITDDIRNLKNIVLDERITLTEEFLSKIDVDTYMETERSLIYKKTGERRLYKQLLYHISDNDRSDFIMLLSDRTEEYNITHQLEDALQEAQDASDAKSAFLFNMSHDLRTPMNAIVGLATIISNEANNPEKVKSYSEKILMSGNILFGLINDILDMSKIENRRVTLSEDVFSIPELLEGIVTIVMPQVQQKEQQFSVCVENVREEFFLGDKMRLQQILLNLLSNAIKYTQEKGSIFLSIVVLEREEEYQKLRFKVQDNGMGMTEEFQKNIFDPFVRMHENSNKIQGTGLGMAIVKSLVDLMDGTISLESRLEEGSTFIVDLRLKTEKCEECAEFWAKNDISRILLIDDEREICENIQRVMENTGVEIDYITDEVQSEITIQQAADRGIAYDIAIVDWEMPGTDGIKTIRRIREEVKQPPMLLLMALNWNEIKKEALGAGADGLISKPFFVSALQKSIADIRKLNDAVNNGSDEGLLHNNSISGIHFLVVEDYEINREILEELLNMEGATCESAVNGQEGAEIFEQSEEGHFDMILMDVQMPVLNGYEATMRIRSGKHPQSSTIPIIAMTANAFVEDVEKALASGMTAHVAKPINMKVFKETVNRLKRK